MSFWSQLGLQEGISVIMQQMIFFHDYMMMLLCVIMVFVSYLFVVIMVSTGVDKYVVESHFLELIWTVVPMVFLIFMAYPSLYILYMTEDLFLPSVVMKVIGHQWYWEYEYALLGGNTFSFDSYMLNLSDASSLGMFRCLDTDNRVSLPCGVSTLALVTSADVLHSWTVPSLGVKVDAVPGRLNFLSLLPVSCGVYYGQCSELCGSNHSFMPISVEVVSVSDFLSFVASSQS